MAGRDFGSLKKDINKAEYIGYETPHHKKHGTIDNIKGFHKLKNGSKEFLIADTPQGLKYYMSKQLDDIGHRPSRVEPISSNTIIPPTSQNLNPSQVQKPLSHNDWLEWLKRKRKNIGW